MSKKNVTAVVKANPDKGIEEQLSVTFEYDLPDSVDAYKEKFGEEVTKSILDQQTTIKVQAGARDKLKKGKTAEEIQAWASSFVPGAAPQRKDPVDKIADLFAGLSDEQKRAFLQNMKKGA